MCPGQAATVKCDVASRKFSIERGTKQGDPISPILFNAVLEKVMRELKAKWTQEGKGVKFNSGMKFLQHLRFADDLLLIATSKKHVQSMLEDLSVASGKVGLVLHMGETRVLTNGVGPGTRCAEIPVHDRVVEVTPPGDSTIYLGRALSLRCPHDAELKHRISRAWAKFWVFKQELTSRNYSLHHRMRLFQYR